MLEVLANALSCSIDGVRSYRLYLAVPCLETPQLVSFNVCEDGDATGKRLPYHADPALVPSSTHTVKQSRTCCQVKHTSRLRAVTGGKTFNLLRLPGWEVLVSPNLLYRGVGRNDSKT